jgi:hypothetical protein
MRNAVTFYKPVGTPVCYNSLLVFSKFIQSQRYQFSVPNDMQHCYNWLTNNKGSRCV